MADLPTGPKDAKSSALALDEEAIIIAFRRHTLLPLDDCFYALQPTIPHLTRSSLHRCLQPHDISRLPEVDGDKPAKRKFKSYPIGYFHIDIADVQTAEGKLHLFVAVDRTSKFAYAELHQKAGKMVAAAFLRNLIAALPCRLHIVLTDRAIGTPLVRETMARGIQFTNHDRHIYAFEHIFDRVCREYQIEHQLTKVKHPWTNGQLERMLLGVCRRTPASQRNRTIKDATVKRFHYDDHTQLRPPCTPQPKALAAFPPPMTPMTRAPRTGFALITILAFLFLLAALTLTLQARSGANLRLIARLTADLQEQTARDTLRDRLRPLIAEALSSRDPLPGHPRLDGSAFPMTEGGKEWLVRILGRMGCCIRGL